MGDVINLEDFRAQALERIDSGALAYLEGGALDEITLRENECAFRRLRLRPRVLRDATHIDVTTSVLGRPIAMPVGVAPTARHGLYHPSAEFGTASGAAASGVPFVASTMSSLSLEEIAAAGGLRWFQLYVLRDHELTEALVRRAAAAGYEALVVTVDAQVPSKRERDLQPGIVVAPHALGNFAAAPDELVPGEGAVSMDPAMTWDDIAWLRALTPLPIVLKGIMCAEDAALAVEHGAAAVWVSNHGGRALDRLPASIDVLAEIAGAVAGRAEVYLDGGVRRGIDVAIALALGARAVFLGRPMLWALAVDGERGVARALEIVRLELLNAMALLGAATCGELVPELVRPPTAYAYEG